ncbi:MAG: hypothetical protein ACFCD0_03090 [Gemmataceae bacterium]
MATQDDAQQWNRVAQELEAYRADQKVAWGDLDNLVLGRYLAGECSSDEVVQIEEALQKHPELGLLLECVSDVLAVTPHSSDHTIPETIPFRRAETPKKASKLLVLQAASWATAACLLFGIGFWSGKIYENAENDSIAPTSNLTARANSQRQQIVQAKLVAAREAKVSTETKLRDALAENEQLLVQLRQRNSEPKFNARRLGKGRIELASADDDLPKEIVLAQVNEHLARYYVENEEFTMAEAKQQEVVKLLDKVKGPEHPKTEDARACLQSIQAMNVVCGNYAPVRYSRGGMGNYRGKRPARMIKASAPKANFYANRDVDKLHAHEKMWFSPYQPTARIQKHYAPYMCPKFEKFKDRRWESARERFRKFQNQVSSSDVYSGYALNRLLRDFRRVRDLKIETDTPPVSADTLGQITVTKAFGNVGLIRSTGKIQWPPALETVLNDKHRRDLTSRLHQIVTQRTEGLDTTDESQILIARLIDLEKQFAKRVEKISAGDYLRGVRFLVNLKSAVRGIHLGDLEHNEKYQEFVSTGQPVQEVIHYLTSNGLRIAPAVPGDESAYTALYMAFTNYKVLLELPAQN